MKSKKAQTAFILLLLAISCFSFYYVNSSPEACLGIHSAELFQIEEAKHPEFVIPDVEILKKLIGIARAFLFPL